MVVAATKAGIISRLLPVGQLITIVPEAHPQEGDVQPEGYPSRIEDLLDDTVVVSMPIVRRSLVVLPLNRPVSVYFNREGSRYRFRAIVNARAESPFPVLYLTDVGEVRRDERRAHARVDLLVEPVSLLVVDDDTPTITNPRSTLVVNISAGGLGLVSRRPFPVGSVIHIGLDLPRGFERLEAQGEVVRCNIMEIGGLQKWQVGVAFRNLSPKEQDRIAAFVLCQQQLMRRRGF